MGLVMDGAMQQAPQPGRQFMATMLPDAPRAAVAHGPFRGRARAVPDGRRAHCPTSRA